SDVPAEPAGSAVPASPHEDIGTAHPAGPPEQDDGAEPASGAEADGPTASQGIRPRLRRSRLAPGERAGGTKRVLPPRWSANRGRDQGASPASAADPAGAGTDEGAEEPAGGIELDFAAAGPVEEYEPGALAVVAGKLSALGRALAGSLGRLVTELVAVMVRDRLEAIAVGLLGLGGAIYPPIWLIGAFVALWSRKWDHRDKWLGLALPVFLVIFAAMLVVVLGGQRQTIGQYTMEFWVAAGRLSRLFAVLRAGYLLGRAVKYQGTRIKRQPPWTQQGGSD